MYVRSLTFVGMLAIQLLDILEILVNTACGQLAHKRALRCLARSPLKWANGSDQGLLVAMGS